MKDSQAAASPPGLPLRLGVSSCLLGNEVRFDSGHKRDRFVTDQLGAWVEWVSVCPEVESGMGTPRPAMHLEREGNSLRLIEIKSRADHTRKMERYAAQRVRALRGLELSGFVLKKDSPSCGMTRVRVYAESGMAKRDGRGLFAAALMQAAPNLPVEDEGRLHDPNLRENFIERVFAYQRLRSLFRGRWSNAQVVAFHTAHKLQLMAHSPSAYGELGRRVAAVKRTPRAQFRDEYQAAFMQAMQKLATRGRNTNVLQHAVGYLKKRAGAGARTELAGVIEDYRTGLVPLIVPLTLIRHHVREQGVDYLAGQTFLEPHPKELMLRNHV